VGVGHSCVHFLYSRLEIDRERKIESRVAVAFLLLQLHFLPLLSYLHYLHVIKYQ